MNMKNRTKNTIHRFTLTLLFYKSISIKIIIIHVVDKKQFINEKIEFIKNCIIHAIKYPIFFPLWCFMINYYFLLAKI